MARIISGTPSATDAAASPAYDGNLENGEQAASPYEEQMLGKVMGLVYHSFNDPKKLRMLEHMMLKAPDLGSAIGHMTFTLLFTIYQSAKKSGVAIPTSVMLGQGGAVMETIERMMQIAEHAGIPDRDPDHIREEAFGVVMDSIKQNAAAFEQGQQDQGQGQPQQGAPPQGLPPAAPANPLSSAVQQGLMGGGQ